MKQQKFEATTKDGVTLKGILLIPENPKAVIQFNGGTATKKEFYLSFLNYIADHGYICCLWDYRGSGESAPNNLAKCDYVFSDYGTKDMPAIKAYLQAQFPDLPFLLVGHSVGGQQIGFMDDLSGVKGNVNLAVSAGYYPNMPFAYRMKAYFFYYVFSPLSVLFSGYVKAKSFKLMENLPKGVVYQWRDWLEKEDYFFDDKFYGKSVPVGNFADYNFPIHVFWTTDDTISGEKNTKNYWKHVKSSQPIGFKKLTPSEFGLKQIDHFGFFKKNMKEKFWHKVLEKLEEYVKN